MSEYRSIIMRSNRLLGANLVENNLIRIDDLESANERLFQLIETGTERDSSLLSILVNEMSLLDEDVLLGHLIEEHNLGLIDLRDLELADDCKARIDPGICWATWTVPFDREDEFYYVASAYYLSPAVRQHWERELDGPIIWFGATMESLTEFLERLENERIALNPAAAKQGA